MNTSFDGIAGLDDRVQGATGRALRFFTAGSVDDGKSTLIGRLLFDSQAILADQLETLHERAGGAAIDLSLLTDGLEAEREQGITIDVAFRYFATRRRKFIIADAPGHEQYTRNLVTAAAGSDAAVVLVDITRLDLRAQPPALLAQTRRHALLAQLLHVPRIVFAVNKLDAVADPRAAFATVREAIVAFAAQAGIEPAGIVPISALRGDNVARPSAAAGYHGPTLLELLESLPAAEEDVDGALSIPVQYVARLGAPAAPGATAGPRRTLWGRIARGRVRLGDTIEVFPSGEPARVAGLEVAGDEVASALAGQSAGLVLDRPLDVSRGDWIGAPGTLRATTRFSATLAWLDTDPARIGRRYAIRHGSRWVQARVTAIESRLDITTLADSAADELGVNEIGRVVVEAQDLLPVSPYRHHRAAGAAIVVDPATHRTSGALLIEAIRSGASR